MFGRKHRTSHHYNGATVTTTQYSTTSTLPRHHAAGGGFLARLRPRRNTPPTYGTYDTVTTHRAPRSGRRSGLGHKKRTHHHHHHTTSTTAPAVVPARKTTLGDKVSGAMLRLRGSMSGRPGVKAAGTRRMHGTDGRGTRRYY